MQSVMGLAKRKHSDSSKLEFKVKAESLSLTFANVQWRKSFWGANVLSKVERWIDQTNIDYANRRVSCECFSEDFNGFYPREFLKNAYFVIVASIPKPDFPGLREIGLGDFIDMKVDGITYKNTYYILPHEVKNLRLHFHELVHVAQWKYLGAANFIQRYIEEIQNFGYAEAPLEKMAYGLDAHYSNNGQEIDVLNYVSRKI